MAATRGTDPSLNSEENTRMQFLRNTFLKLISFSKPEEIVETKPQGAYGSGLAFLELKKILD